jgi:hypothetical protein
MSQNVERESGEKDMGVALKIFYPTIVKSTFLVKKLHYFEKRLHWDETEVQRSKFPSSRRCLEVRAMRSTSSLLNHIVF